jgi:outer membrane biosynthesis protein TonB
MKTTRLALIVSLSMAALAFGSADARAERRAPLSSAQIRQVMSRHAPDVRECYMRHSMEQQGPMGTVTIELLVRAGGQVAAVEVEAAGTDDKKLEQCVSQLAKKWTFPKSSEQTLVKYPMMFVHTQTATAAGPAKDTQPRAKQGAGKGGRSGS